MISTSQNSTSQNTNTSQINSQTTSQNTNTSQNSQIHELKKLVKNH